MGQEDRDWYREEHAKKHGMRYNKSNATYADDPQPWSDSKHYRKPPSPPVEQGTMSRAAPRPSNDWHWLMQLLLWLAICGALFVAFWLLNDYQKAKRQAQAATIAAEHWKEQAEAAQRQLDQLRKNQRFDFFKR